MKIIIDCDPGIDDMEAIIMALAAPHVDIVAITGVAGNAGNDQTYINIQKILHSCKVQHIPIYKGCYINLMGREPSSDGYFGNDGFCELDIRYEELEKQPMSSAEALLHYTKQFPEQIHLIAIGPLTNLAVAYLVDKSFPKRLASLHVMGGDRSEKTVNNVTPYAEFNCYSDPVAWKLVMSNFKLARSQKINLIDFTFCQKNLLPPSFLKNYFENSYADTPTNQKAVLIRKTHTFMSKKFTSFGDVTCDPFAIFVCIYSEYKYSGDTCILEKVCFEGEKIGHTEFKQDPNGNILLINKVDFETFLQKLLDSIKP